MPKVTRVRKRTTEIITGEGNKGADPGQGKHGEYGIYQGWGDRQKQDRAW